MRFKIDCAIPIVGSKFTVFTLYLRAIFQVQDPGGLLEGRFNGGFFCVTGLEGLYLEGLIHGGAYTWRSLFSEFYGIHISINGTKEAWYPDRTKLASIAKQVPAHGLLWPKETCLSLQEQNRQDRSIPMFPNLSGSQGSAIKRDRPSDKELHTRMRRTRGAGGP